MKIGIRVVYDRGKCRNIRYGFVEKDGHVYGFLQSWRKDLPKEIE